MKAGTGKTKLARMMWVGKSKTCNTTSAFVAPLAPCTQDNAMLWNLAKWPCVWHGACFDSWKDSCSLEFYHPSHTLIILTAFKELQVALVWSLTLYLIYFYFYFLILQCGLFANPSWGTLLHLASKRYTRCFYEACSPIFSWTCLHAN